MATSGISILQLSRDDIINAALRKLVVIGQGQTADADQLSVASQALNNLVAEFRTLGMSIWARRMYNLTLVSGQKDYVFGVGQAENTPYPLKIYQAVLQQPPIFNINQDVNILSFMDFGLLPEDSTGTVVNMMYQAGINQGTVTVWPTPDATMPVGSRLRLTYQTPFEYFIAGVDTPDFPEEWNNALIYNLAYLLADEYGVADSKLNRIAKQADLHLSTALSGGTEEASLYIQRDWAGAY